VILDFAYDAEQLTQLLAFESDPFNAWEAGQRLATRLILDATAAIAAGKSPVWPQGFVDAARSLLTRHVERGAAFVAEALTLPGEATLAESMEEVNPDALHAARMSLRQHLARSLQDELTATHAALAPSGPYQPTADEAGRRALRNLCLGYLLELNSAETRQLAWQQFTDADNMTDQFAALSGLAQIDCAESQSALAQFYERWQHEALVVDKWLAVQAGSRRPDTLQTVRRLSGHAAFDLGNPNKVYALLRTFGANLVHFHAANGAGYAFLAEQIKILDSRNPQVASRLTRCFDRWKKFDGERQRHSRAALESLRDHPGLSRNVAEIVTRALG
jgi:aminopeptidase N